MKFVLFLGVLSGLVSCGGVTDSTQKLFGKDFEVLEGRTTLVETEKTLSGTGKLIFATPIELSHVVALGGNLENGGSLGIFFHANANGVGGVEFTLTREDSALKLIWVGPFGNVDVLDKALLELDENGKFGLQIGWSNKTQQLIIVTKQTKQTPTTFAIAAEGAGTRWGLKLDRATLDFLID